MKKEDFVKLGISEDLAVQAADAVSEVLKNYVPKADYDTKVSELETANNSVKDLTGKLKNFDGVDVEGLKTSVKNWETKYNADMANVQAKGKNPKAIKALLDMDKINLKDDGTLEGLDLEGLKKSDGYLFDTETVIIRGTGAPKGGNSITGGIDSFISAARNGAGLK